MVKIDSHQHFWKFDPKRDNWITDEMSVIRRDFLPEDLLPLLQKNGIYGCVAVQADQSEAQNEFLLNLAAENKFIKGIVGWVDLQAENLEERLSFYKQQPLMKGFRHVLQDEPNRAFMLQPNFKRGISKLASFGFTYDILIYPDQLAFTAELVAAFPNQPFIIDHLAKPAIKDRALKYWQKDIKSLASHPNVSCKASGMITEADWNLWKPEDFTPYLDTIFEAFGPERVLFGSDWPVCLVAGSYDQMLEILKNYTAKLSQQEQMLFWGGSAIDFYKLSI